MSEFKSGESAPYSVGDVARILGIKLRRAYRLVHRFPALRIPHKSRRIFIGRQEFESFLDREGSTFSLGKGTVQDRDVERSLAPTVQSGVKGTDQAVGSPQPMKPSPSGGGQRELRLPERYGAPIVIFTCPQFLG
jgi:hypothetical protein